MPRRQRPEAQEAQVRLTRSAVRSTKPSTFVDRDDSSPPRKRRRAQQPGVSIENKHNLEIPRPKRTYGRRTKKLVDVQRDGTTIDDSVVDKRKLVSKNPQCGSLINTPQNTRRRVILDSVEIVYSRKMDDDATDENRAPSLPTLATKAFNGNVSPVKASAMTLEDSRNDIMWLPKSPKRAPALPEELPKCLPRHLHPCIERQKQAVLNAFHDPPFVEQTAGKSIEAVNNSSPNSLSLHQLVDLLGGTIERGEGNSCIVFGPAGSGKSKIFEKALEQYAEEHRPIVIRLNGHVQHSDRLAIREIARQVVEQTGSKTFESLNADDDSNPFDDGETGKFAGNLPPPSHLPSVISALPTLPRPVVVLLDAFSIFTEQPRQALLYCLLDTVQSCRAGSASNRGLAVVGLTTRVDVVNFLEKRVKSRFSHRMFRTACLRKPDDWIAVLKDCLYTDMDGLEATVTSEWRTVWRRSVDMFFQDLSVGHILSDLFGISRDIRCLFRTMTETILRISPDAPYLTSQSLKKCIASQRSKPQSVLLTKLTYPSMSLCIAAQHCRTAGHDSFTFEMLHELFANQVRTSSAAPVTMGGGSIGMVNIGRRVLAAAFEDLVRMKIFVHAGPISAGLGKDFIKFRCTVDRDDVKRAVDRIGQTSLKKWFSKAQQ